MRMLWKLSKPRGVLQTSMTIREEVYGQKIKQAYGKQCAGVHFDINLCFPDVLYAAKIPEPDR